MAQKTRRVPSGDVTLAVDVIGKGPPLLFAHGLGSCRHHVRPLLAPLAQRFQLILFDQRGHCESTPVCDPALYDPRLLARDIGAVLDDLGVARAIVGGESMGAATALLFATLVPERVTRLLQVGPTVIDRPNPGHEMISALADFAEKHGLEATADAVALAALTYGVPRSAAEMVTAHWSHHQRKSFIAAHRAVPNWVLFDSLAPIAALPMPIGILAWGTDPTRPLSQARRLATAARSGRLETFESIAALTANPTCYAETLERLIADPMEAVSAGDPSARRSSRPPRGGSVAAIAGRRRREAR